MDQQASNNSSSKQPIIYIIAGEPSGDFIGSKLINKLKLANPNLVIKGIGGSLMQKEGLHSLFNIKTISIMGLFEILPKLFTILKLIKKTIADINQVNPDVLITIDSPGFNLKIAKTIKQIYGKKIKLIHYVAPSVWAYKPKRAKKFAKIFDYLFCILPFEPPYFLNEHLKTYFVGHPIVESGANNGNSENFITKYHLTNQNKNIVLLPGSRMREVTNMLPIFLAAINIVEKQGYKFNIIIPTIPALIKDITSYCKARQLHRVIVVSDVTDKYNAFNAANLAIAASGTVSLELALAKVPMLIAYKLNLFTTLLIRLIIKIKFVSIVNIIANKAIIPEFLGHNCTANNIANQVINILNTTNTNIDNYNETAINSILQELGYNQFIPSEETAKKVLQILKEEI